MIRRINHESDDDSTPGGLGRWFAASFVVHAGMLALVALLLLTANSHVRPIGSKVTFIPRGHAQGAFNDPTAAAVAAPPHPEPVTEPAPTTQKQPEPPPKIEEKVKPPDPPPVKPKEEKPKPKAKEPDPVKVKEKAPPKPKVDEKKKDVPKEKPADKNAKPSKEKPKDQKLAMAQLAPDDEPNPKAKGAVRPQQGKPDGEEKVGIETHEGEEGPLSWWSNQVQRLVERKWLSPEGVLIVPDHNAAQIKFTVNRKGELVGQPEVIKEASDPEVAKTGLKALLDSAPLPPLPEGYTENQHEVIITFRLVR